MTHTSVSPSPAPGSGIDLDSLERKYQEEREKRLRAARQYLAVEKDSKFDVDPYAGPPPARDSVVADHDVVILGGGFAGMVAAIHLKAVGVEDLCIIEKAADFGGTWYWNRYPGLTCDVESYIYFPFLEETGYMPTEKYTSATEIFEYAQRLGKHYDLYAQTLFQTRTEDVAWDDDAARWVIRTNRGDLLRARYFITATGPLHRPKLPAIPGLETFEGPSFHTSRWDYAYTGGDNSGGLVGLRGKRVAVIGTGTTAIQIVPKIAEYAEHLYVFQRTPSAVDIRANRPTDPDWFAQLEPGWQRRRKANFELLLNAVPQEEDLVSDQWTVIWGFPELEMPADGSPPDLEAYMRRVMEYDHAQMERIRARVDELVDDRATAEALKPWFTTHCKRPCFHDGYLQTFNQPNVTLVDTQGRGVEQISAQAVHFGGQAYEVDCIIYATGFETIVSPSRTGAFQIRGRNGNNLDDHWAKRVRTVHGISSHGFPNMFVIGGIRHAAITINVPWMGDEQALHVAELIKSLLDRSVRSFEVTDAAEQAWADRMAEKARYTTEAALACTPGIFNNEGKADGGTPLFVDGYGGGPLEYIDLLAEWRCSGFENDTVLTYEPVFEESA